MSGAAVVDAAPIMVAGGGEDRQRSQVTYFCHTCRAGESTPMIAEPDVFETGELACSCCGSCVVEQLRVTEEGREGEENVDADSPFSFVPPTYVTEEMSDRRMDSDRRRRRLRRSGIRLPGSATSIPSPSGSSSGQIQSPAPMQLQQVMESLGRVNGQVVSSMGLSTSMSTLVQQLLVRAGLNVNSNPVVVQAGDDNPGSLERLMARLMQNEGYVHGINPVSKETLASLDSFTVSDSDICGDCSVCKCEIEEGSEVIKLPCGHVYHSGCIKPWFERQSTCPCCRAVVKPVEPDPE